MSVFDEHGSTLDDREPPPRKPPSPAKVPVPARYAWQIKGIPFDFYRLCQATGVIHPAQSHALKKVIRAGQGDKPVMQDIDEAILALQRWREMILEDRPRMNAPTEPRHEK